MGAWVLTLWCLVPFWMEWWVDRSEAAKVVGRSVDSGGAAARDFLVVCHARRGYS